MGRNRHRRRGPMVAAKDALSSKRRSDRNYGGNGGGFGGVHKGYSSSDRLSEYMARYEAERARNRTVSELSAEQQWRLMAEMQSLSERVENVAQSVDVVQSSVNGVHRKMTDVERMTMMKLQNFSKTEKLMLRMLGKLQKEVDAMKGDIAFIKDCWIDSAQRDSAEEYQRDALRHRDRHDDAEDTDLEEDGGRSSRGRRRHHNEEQEDVAMDEEEESASYVTDSRSY